MKVSYIQCDICGQKITSECYKYSTLYSMPDPVSWGNEVAFETKMDICKSCMDRFKEWVAAKETKNGANT